MGRWGRADFRQLQQLERQIDKLEKADFDKFCREAANELAGRLHSSVVKRTPTGDPPDWVDKETKKKYWSGYVGGTLKKSWRILPIEKNGDEYVITVENPIAYASYIEYGHRQQTGRYVPAIQRQLKEGWAPGHFMLTISAQEVENLMPALLEKRLYELIKGLF